MPPPPHSRPENVLKVSHISTYLCVRTLHTRQHDPPRNNITILLIADDMPCLIASTRTHRSRSVTSGFVASPRTCRFKANPEQPHRLPRAGDAPLRRTVCRSTKRKACQGWSLPVQEHCTKHKRGNDRGLSIPVHHSSRIVRFAD